ncbi:transporter substrate-binding domain-containing protein [Deinococcus misasensis]|uniref:transporter substrate-binding domain-containing protein n=1 Tax=Deinococcus misasensis TaxID=392413 RepID=UPI00055799C9|nr:transporter substrate-binding domain-containing protein [Deinococcus misasensis]
MKKILIPLTLLLLGAAQAELLDTVKSRGTLKIALEGTYPPFNYRDEKNQLVGFDVDIARELAERLGVKPEFITTEWSGIIAGLQAGKYDVIVNQVSITSERQKILDFSKPYIFSSAQLIVRKGEPRKFKTLNDLKGKKLGVGLGSNYYDMAKSVAGIELKTYQAAPDTLRDLSLGRIDAALNDSLLMAYLTVKTRLPVKGGAQIGEATSMGIPFQKNNPKFAAAINKALDDMKNDGTYLKISKKWFGKDVSKAPKDQ